ncbi:MAG: hypothetical protein AAGI53_09450 [Planctomycetota bacterium]
MDWLDVATVELDGSIEDAVRVPLCGEGERAPTAIRVDAWGDPWWSTAMIAVRDGSGQVVSEFSEALLVSPASASVVIDEPGGATELECRVSSPAAGQRVRVRVRVASS